MKFGKQSRSEWETGITRFVAWLIALRGVQANHVGCVHPVSFPFVWNSDCQTLLSVGTADWNRRYPTLINCAVQQIIDQQPMRFSPTCSACAFQPVPEQFRHGDTCIPSSSGKGHVLFLVHFPKSNIWNRPSLTPCLTVWLPRIWEEKVRWWNLWKPWKIKHTKCKHCGQGLLFLWRTSRGEASQEQQAPVAPRLQIV